MRPCLLSFFQLAVIILLHQTQGFDIKTASLSSKQSRKLGVDSVTGRKMVDAQNYQRYNTHQIVQQSSSSGSRNLVAGSRSHTSSKVGRLSETKKDMVTNKDDAKRSRSLDDDDDEYEDMNEMDYAPATRRTPIHN